MLLLLKEECVVLLLLMEEWLVLLLLKEDCVGWGGGMCTCGLKSHRRR